MILMHVDSYTASSMIIACSDFEKYWALDDSVSTELYTTSVMRSRDRRDLKKLLAGVEFKGGYTALQPVYKIWADSKYYCVSPGGKITFRDSLVSSSEAIVSFLNTVTGRR